MEAIWRYFLTLLYHPLSTFICKHLLFFYPILTSLLLFLCILALLFFSLYTHIVLPLILFIRLSVCSICSLVKAFWFMVGVTNKQILTSGPLQDLWVHRHKHETFLCAHTTQSLQVHKCTAECTFTAIKAYKYTDLLTKTIHTHTHTHQNPSNVQYAHLHLLPWQWSITFPPFILCKPPEVNHTCRQV